MRAARGGRRDRAGGQLPKVPERAHDLVAAELIVRLWHVYDVLWWQLQEAERFVTAPSASLEPGSTPGAASGVAPDPTAAAYARLRAEADVNEARRRRHAALERLRRVLRQAEAAAGWSAPEQGRYTAQGRLRVEYLDEQGERRFD
jgi:hypothetical protein